MAAFVVVNPPQQRICSTVTSRPIATELHGIRSALQKRFRKFREDRAARRKQHEPNLNGNGETEIFIESNGYSAISTVQQDNEVNGEECDLESTYVLPPRNEAEMTQYQKEFRTMMKVVESYTDKCVQSVADPKSRAIFAGARAGAVSPEVYRSFEILFEDLVPVRIAGRMIFKKLSQVMEDSRDDHQQQVDIVASVTGLSASDVESGRFAFLSVGDYKDDGDTVLNLDQLVDTGVATTIVEMLGYEDFDDFISSTCQNERRELKFDETMVALQRCPAGSSAAECNPHLVLQEIEKKMNNSTDMMKISDRKAKYEKRYDDMVESFAEWEQLMPSGDSRWLEVLRGCFVGAKIEEVVKALKIVYIDYSALRLAGDSIYKIMGKLIRKKQKSTIS